MIQEVQARGLTCLSLRWSLSHEWMQDCRMDLELRVKTADSNQWISKPVSEIHYKIDAVS